MSPYEKIDLGAAGLAYLEHTLRNYGGLADLLCPQINGGTAVALMPRGTSLERALEFEAGGLMSMSEGQDCLFSYLRELGEGSVVLQDLAARIDETESDPTPKFWCSSNLYWYIERGRLTAWALHETLRSVASFTVIGALVTTRDIAATLLPDGSVEPAVLAALARHTQAIFANAYDQESFVVWQRAERQLFN